MKRIAGVLLIAFIIGVLLLPLFSPQEYSEYKTLPEEVEEYNDSFHSLQVDILKAAADTLNPDSL